MCVSLCVGVCRISSPAPPIVDKPFAANTTEIDDIMSIKAEISQLI